MTKKQLLISLIFVLTSIICGTVVFYFSKNAGLKLAEIYYEDEGCGELDPYCASPGARPSGYRISTPPTSSGSPTPSGSPQNCVQCNGTRLIKGSSFAIKNGCEGIQPDLCCGTNAGGSARCEGYCEVEVNCQCAGPMQKI